MALVVTANNLIGFMLSWEIMSLSSFFLVVYDYESEENRKAGYLYFVFTQVGAIVRLAIIGGLALACFTKVVGVVFQGEPRSKIVENADEKGLTMLVPMLILAAACIVIGVFTTFFMTMALKAVAALGLDYGRIPLEPFIELTADRRSFAGTQTLPTEEPLPQPCQ